MENIESKITLVGAGPGDPDLLSLKGLKALESADIVLYDALVHPKILGYIREGAEKKYVGKRKGAYKYSQEEINQLIVDCAKKYKHVVRLKGGDPYIFGRGHEELVFAEKEGYKVDVVPGISSCYSVPELAGIPLTRRGINDSFWVVTGTTREHVLSSDIDIAARSKATVVILMGMHKLAEIVEVFKNNGREKTPVAIIQNGSRENQNMVVADVENIQSVVTQYGIGAPAIIVIGEVVKVHPEYQLFLKKE